MHYILLGKYSHNLHRNEYHFDKSCSQYEPSIHLLINKVNDRVTFTNLTVRGILRLKSVKTHLQMHEIKRNGKFNCSRCVASFELYKLST